MRHRASRGHMTAHAARLRSGNPCGVKADWLVGVMKVGLPLEHYRCPDFSSIAFTVC